jgi:hypothetical protein
MEPLIREVGPFHFAPLVSSALGWETIASLEILLLRPTQPGDLINTGGDLDNRMKTLFDALRLPAAGELPKDEMPSEDEMPFLFSLKMML